MDCIETNNIISILSLAIPLFMSEILALTNSDSNGIIDGLIKLCKRKCKKNKVEPMTNSV